MEWRWEANDALFGYEGGRFRVAIRRQEGAYVVWGDSWRPFIVLGQAQRHAEKFAAFWSEAYLLENPDEEWRRRCETPEQAPEHADPFLGISVSGCTCSSCELARSIKEQRDFFEAHPAFKQAWLKPWKRKNR